MSRLLEVYEGMLKEAETAEVEQNLTTMFSKYAEAAEAALKEEYGTDYNVDDVASLSVGLMERDAEILSEQEKVAEYDAIGRQLAHQYVQNMQKEAAEVKGKKSTEKQPVPTVDGKHVEQIVADSKRGGE